MQKQPNSFTKVDLLRYRRRWFTATWSSPLLALASADAGMYPLSHMTEFSLQCNRVEGVDLKWCAEMHPRYHTGIDLKGCAAAPTPTPNGPPASPLHLGRTSAASRPHLDASRPHLDRRFRT